MEAAKKTYHMACKEEKLAATREANGKTEASVTPDQQKKLHEKVDKCKQDVQKVRKNSAKPETHDKSMQINAQKQTQPQLCEKSLVIRLSGRSSILAGFGLMINQFYF